MKKAILIILLALLYNATSAQDTALFDAIETAVLQKGVKIMVWEDEYSPKDDIRPWGTQKQECVNAWGANTPEGKLIAQASTEEYAAVANQIRGALMQTKYNFAGKLRAMANDANNWTAMKNAYQGACFSIIRKMYAKQYNDGLMNAVGNWLLSSEMVKASGVIDGTRLASVAEGTKCNTITLSSFDNTQSLRYSSFPINTLRFGDFDGDGMTDVFVSDANDGGKWKYSSGGRTEFIELGGASAWPIEKLGFGDFDGDGKTDIFLSDANDGNKWKYSSGGKTNWIVLGGASAWPIEKLGFGDFNGDGKTDIFLRDANDGNKWKYSSGGKTNWRGM